MKCRDYKVFWSTCDNCDIRIKALCRKVINFEIPEKFIVVERKDHLKTSWNECPTCGNSVGYRPDEKNFRCPKCTQRILWK